MGKRKNRKNNKKKNVIKGPQNMKFLSWQAKQRKSMQTTDRIRLFPFLIFPFRFIRLKFPPCSVLWTWWRNENVTPKSENKDASWEYELPPHLPYLEYLLPDRIWPHCPWKTFLDTFPIKFRPKFCTLPSRVSSTAKFFCNYCGQQLKSGPPLQLSDTLTGYLGLTFGCWVRCQGFPRILGWNPQLDLHVSPICHAVMLNSKCHPHIYSPYSPSWFSLRV